MAKRDKINVKKALDLPKCRVCNASGSMDTLVVPEMVIGSGNKFDYVFCNSCKSLSIKEIPENLSSHYENYYSFSNFLKTPGLKSFFKNYLLEGLVHPRFWSFLTNPFFKHENDFKLKSLSFIKPTCSDAILDIGSGSGDFVYYLNELGYSQCHGIDPFLEKDIIYPNGATIRKMELSEVKSQFDIITLHHTFEHFVYPQKCLEQIKSKLRKNGICILRIPDIDSYSFKRFKENWIGVHAPFHIFLPSKKALERLLKQCGLRIMHSHGEQVVDFFLMSRETQLGIPNHNSTSIRALKREKKTIKASPWHTSQELRYWNRIKKLVEKWELCDCVCYYIKHDEQLEVDGT